MLFAVGGVLIGLITTRLSNGLNVVLFETGVVFVSLTITLELLLQTVWKKRKNDHGEDRVNEKNLEEIVNWYYV